MKTRHIMRNYALRLVTLTAPLLLGGVGGGLLTSCSNEDYLGGHVSTEGAGTQIQISATAPDGVEWAEGETIGISTSYGYYDATARNREYACQADGTTFMPLAGEAIYLKGNATLLAYYPYSGTEGAEPIINLNTLDQTNIAPCYFATAENVGNNSGNVNLSFKDAYATLRLSVTVPAGESIKSYRLSGYAQEAEVDPFTFSMKLSAPDDMTVTGNDIRDITIRLIPQTIAADAAIPARLVLVGALRSYTVDMSGVELKGGETHQAVIDVTGEVSTIEFVPGDSQWSDSGFGGNITAN